MFFNIGSEYNGVVRDSDGNVVLDANGNPTYQLTTDPVSASGLISGTLQGDSIYMVKLHDNNGTPVALEPDADRLGLRNAASMAIDPADGRPRLRRQRDRRQRRRQVRLEYRRTGPDPGGADRAGTDEFFGFPEMINGQLEFSYVKTIDEPGHPETVVNPGVGVQPLIAFEPLADPVLTAQVPRARGRRGSRCRRPISRPGSTTASSSGSTASGTEGGIANDENPLVFADPSTGQYFDFVSNDEPGVGHFDGAVSTSTRSSWPTSRPGASWTPDPAKGRSIRCRLTRR